MKMVQIIIFLIGQRFKIILKIIFLLQFETNA